MRSSAAIRWCKQREHISKNESRRILGKDGHQIVTGTGGRELAPPPHRPALTYQLNVASTTRPPASTYSASVLPSATGCCESTVGVHEYRRVLLDVDHGVAVAQSRMSTCGKCRFRRASRHVEAHTSCDPSRRARPSPSPEEASLRRRTRSEKRTPWSTAASVNHRIDFISSPLVARRLPSEPTPRPYPSWRKRTTRARPRTSSRSSSRCSQPRAARIRTNENIGAGGVRDG